MTPFKGIVQCEERHSHGSRCRQACEICDGLYPPRILVSDICPACWREHQEEAP